jgi:peptidoglycan/xylan/chitin deacetylase (PgdA/CDA1 family)
VARAAGRKGEPLVVLRSVDPADWRADFPEEIIESVLAAVGPGDIVCLHDGIAPGNTGTDSRAATAAAVARLVPKLIERDLRPVTVSELLA